MVLGCYDGGAQLYVLFGTIRFRYLPDILQLIRSKVVHLVLAFVAVESLTEIGCSDLEDLEWFAYSYTKTPTVVSPAKLPLARSSAGGSKVRQGGLAEIKQRFRLEVVTCVMFIKYGRLVWRPYLANETDAEVTFTLEKQNALAVLATPAASAEAASVVVFEGRLNSIYAMPCDEESWTIEALVEFDEKKLIREKRRLCDHQESHRAKRHKVLISVSKAVSLTAGLVSDVGDLSKSGG